MSRLRERGGVGDSTPAAVGGRLGQYIAPKYVIRTGAVGIVLVSLRDLENSTLLSLTSSLQYDIVSSR